VLLLHDFDHKKGGGRTQDGWGKLAEDLQKAGYAVLSFDFRGFGESTEVSKETFWDTKNYPHNSPINVKYKGKPPESIDHKNFSTSYYAYLLYDVAAAKAYLDRANDRKEVNSSNLIIIGAGQGATLGAAWLANEAARRRDKRPPNMAFGLPNPRIDLAEPESKDVAGCLWLSISPSIGSRSVGTSLRGTNGWLTQAVKTSKVPMAFYYGETEKGGADFSAGLVKSLKAIEKDLVIGSPVKDTNLSGSKLLPKANTAILQSLEKVMKVRGNREQVSKKVEDSAYYYQTPQGRLMVNKKAGDEVPPVSLGVLGLQ